LISAFGVVAIAEMGDKTQFLVMALTACYKKRDIFIGIIISIIMLNILAVALGTVINKYVPIDLIKLIAGAMFLVFAFTTLKKNDDIQEESCETKKTKLPPFLTIALTFFLAELGDKTQLTILNLSASSEGGETNFLFHIMIFIGGTLGLIFADSIGIIIGIILGKKLPRNVLSLISSAIFAVFGVLTLYDPFKAYLKDYAILGIILLSVIVLGICILAYIKSHKIKK
jgi:putative Ca2+/H+ antiporter (TMEM165/GDT1 family)